MAGLSGDQMTKAWCAHSLCGLSWPFAPSYKICARSAGVNQLWLFPTRIFTTQFTLSYEMFNTLTTFFLTSALAAYAMPGNYTLEGRAAAVDNIVYVTDANKFCMIMPREPHTNVGDSEHPGGMKTYCSPAGRYDSQQGQLPADFWSNVEFKTGNGKNGGRYAQLTGCIRPSHLSRLNPNDAGGQYDSSGGVGGRGNPQGSECLGYKHYVELVEPAGNRACIKCCDDPADCPTNKDTQGCGNVIPGNYFNCW